MTDDWVAVKLLYIGAFITGLIGIGAGISPLRGNRECSAQAQVEFINQETPRW